MHAVNMIYQAASPICIGTLPSGAFFHPAEVLVAFVQHALNAYCQYCCNIQLPAKLRAPSALLGRRRLMGSEDLQHSPDQWKLEQQGMQLPLASEGQPGNAEPQTLLPRKCVPGLATSQPLLQQSWQGPMRQATTHAAVLCLQAPANWAVQASGVGQVANAGHQPSFHRAGAGESSKSLLPPDLS